MTRRLTLVDLLPAPSPVDLQDGDIRVSAEQRAYLAVFDERVRAWRTWDRDRALQARYTAAFVAMLAGAYPWEASA